ncbi:MAG: MarR family winged helix-turn-helix transcriptional regulator [Elainellaceae cyanobacterium]
MTQNPFDAAEDVTAQRIMTGLTKIGLALKSQSWQDASESGLSPTQGQILSLLRTHNPSGLRLSTVAQELAVTSATASDAVTTLVEKGLVQKKKAEDDRRAIAITLTPSGQQQAEQVLGWSDFLKGAIDDLSQIEQTVFLQGLIKIILKLQQQGQISVAKMCVTCPHFRPNVYFDPEYPHHCSFVDAPFGDRHLQIDCPDHSPQSSA